MRRLAQSTSAQANVGQLTDTDLVALQQLMGRRGIFGRDMANTILILSPEVAYGLDQLLDYQSMEKVGEMAALLRGQVGYWRGVPIIVTEAVPEKLDAAGLFDAGTSSNNTKNLFLVVNRQIPKVGWRRDPSIIQERVPGTDTRFIYASARVAFNQMESGGVAAAFNVSV